jgi:hypothetical protein
MVEVRVAELGHRLAPDEVDGLKNRQDPYDTAANRHAASLVTVSRWRHISV